MIADLTPVSSSNVESVGYNYAKHELYVKFKNGSLYVYYHVPYAIYQSFLLAPSKGRFVWQVLRNRGRDDLYRYTRLA